MRGTASVWLRTDTERQPPHGLSHRACRHGRFGARLGPPKAGNGYNADTDPRYGAVGMSRRTGARVSVDDEYERSAHAPDCVSRGLAVCLLSTIPIGTGTTHRESPVSCGWHSCLRSRSTPPSVAKWDGLGSTLEPQSRGIQWTRDGKARIRCGAISVPPSHFRGIQGKRGYGCCPRLLAGSDSQTEAADLGGPGLLLQRNQTCFPVTSGLCRRRITPVTRIHTSPRRKSTVCGLRVGHQRGVECTAGVASRHHTLHSHPILLMSQEHMTMIYPVFAECAHGVDNDPWLRDAFVAMSYGIFPFCVRFGSASVSTKRLRYWTRMRPGSPTCSFGVPQRPRRRTRCRGFQSMQGANLFFFFLPGPAAADALQQSDQRACS
jgi:hypothetical protein